MSPQISVIMSVYKEPIDWLRQSIGSILCQTFRDFEFIIICDNPQYVDGIRLLKDYSEKDCRIQLSFNEENIGLTKSLNKGLAIAKGKYIARMDADDISMPRRFEKQIAFMDSHPDYIVLGTNFTYIGETPLYKKLLKTVEYGNEIIKAHLMGGNCIAHSSVFIRRSILAQHCLKYDENYKSNQDYRLWEMLIPYGKFENLKECLLKYRVSSGQVTKNKPIDQIKQAYAISFRLQKEWLAQNNMLYSYSEIENQPFKILDELKKNKEIVKQTGYKFYLQFVYLDSFEKDSRFKAFLNGDFFRFPFQSKLLYIKKMIRKSL